MSKGPGVLVGRKLAKLGWGVGGAAWSRKEWEGAPRSGSLGTRVPAQGTLVRLS